ncbi:MAG TPA: hypothetical protein ENO21_03440, partial [Firmicutes bacterium]|nr:hypothetical protein [Bacillota bacterium]
MILLIVTSLAPAAADAARQPALPDHLEVYGAEMDEDGVITASGGATLYITSMIEGAEIVVRANDVTYDTVAGRAILEDDVNLTVSGTSLSIDCDFLEYDPLMEQMDVSGMSLTLPLKALVDPSRVPGADSLVTEETHYFNFSPDTLLLAAGRVEFDLSQAHPAVVMHDVMLTHHPHPDPDLFIHAEEIRFTDAEHIVATDIELRISGIELVSWPRLSRGLTPQPKMFSLDFPKFRVNRDVGLAWRQGIKVDLGTFKSDAILDYSPEYGVLLHNSAYY